MSFVEVADRVWVARYAWFDVNVTLVGGERGLLVVDTHASDLAGRAVVDDIAALGAGTIVGVVNTHEHFDHVLGNGAMRAAYGQVPIHAHEDAAANMVAATERIKDLYLAEADPHADPHADEVRSTEVVVPDTRSPPRP